MTFKIVRKIDREVMSALKEARHDSPDMPCTVVASTEHGLKTYFMSDSGDVYVSSEILPDSDVALYTSHRVCHAARGYRALLEERAKNKAKHNPERRIFDSAARLHWFQADVAGAARLRGHLLAWLDRATP